MKNINTVLRNKLLAALAALLLDDERSWSTIDGGGYSTVVSCDHACIYRTPGSRKRPYKLTYKGIMWAPSVVDAVGESLLEKVFDHAEWSVLTTILGELTAE
jgi:hypothetical protein